MWATNLTAFPNRLLSIQFLSKIGSSNTNCNWKIIDELKYMVLRRESDKGKIKIVN